MDNFQDNFEAYVTEIFARSVGAIDVLYPDDQADQGRMAETVIANIAAVLTRSCLSTILAVPVSQKEAARQTVELIAMMVADNKITEEKQPGVSALREKLIQKGRQFREHVRVWTEKNPDPNTSDQSSASPSPESTSEGTKPPGAGYI